MKKMILLSSLFLMGLSVGCNGFTINIKTDDSLKKDQTFKRGKNKREKEYKILETYAKVKVKKGDKMQLLTSKTYETPKKTLKNRIEVPAKLDIDQACKKVKINVRSLVQNINNNKYHFIKGKKTFKNIDSDASFILKLGKNQKSIMIMMEKSEPSSISILDE